MVSDLERMWRRLLNKESPASAILLFMVFAAAPFLFLTAVFPTNPPENVIQEIFLEYRQIIGIGAGANTLVFGVLVYALARVIMGRSDQKPAE
ncbi:MAG: hypothetical protein KAG87_15915 [Marinobacter adhaerens]|nr:hypothetical protein [Marinobacter adhaerens]